MVVDMDYDKNIFPLGTIGNYNGHVRDDHVFTKDHVKLDSYAKNPGYKNVHASEITATKSNVQPENIETKVNE